MTDYLDDFERDWKISAPMTKKKNPLGNALVAVDTVRAIDAARSRCRHQDSLYGRCVDCGMTWAEQAAHRVDVRPRETPGLVQYAEQALTEVTEHE